MSTDTAPPAAPPLVAPATTLAWQTSHLSAGELAAFRLDLERMSDVCGVIAPLDGDGGRVHVIFDNHPDMIFEPGVQTVAVPCGSYHTCDFSARLRVLLALRRSAPQVRIDAQDRGKAVWDALRGVVASAAHALRRTGLAAPYAERRGRQVHVHVGDHGAGFAPSFGTEPVRIRVPSSWALEQSGGQVFLVSAFGEAVTADEAFHSAAMGGGCFRLDY